MKPIEFAGSSLAPRIDHPGDDLARLFLDTTAEGIYCTDREGRFTFANRACVELLGLDGPEELLGQSAHELLHHSHRDGSPHPIEECRIHRALREGIGTHADDEVMWRKDGTYFDAQYWSHPVQHAGELLGCVVTFLDVSAEKALERQLRESADRLGQALRFVGEKAAALAELSRFAEMHPGPVLQLDLDAEVIAANKAAREVFGGEVVGRSWSEICPVSTEETWRQVLSCSDPITLDLPYGGFEYSVTYRHDPTSEVVFVFGIDVTAQRRAERALRQSEKMATLGTLAAGIAHELNNPAAAVQRSAERLRDAVTELERAHRNLEPSDRGMAVLEEMRNLEERVRERAGKPQRIDALERADLEEAIEEWLDERGVEEVQELAPPLAALELDTQKLDDLEQRLGRSEGRAVLGWLAAAFPAYRLLYEIHQGAARISEIVGAFKNYSYLGQAPIQAVDVHEGLDNTLVILRSRLREGVEVVREYDAELPMIAAFGSELNQVWTNLLDNAIDAMNGEGRIVLRTRSEQGHVVVEIEDDGPGIPVEIQSRVFDPFFTTKEPGKGTGLGLATSYSIISEKHGGTLSVTSKPGRTLFEARLPMQAPPASASAESVMGAASEARVQSEEGG